MPPPKIAIIGAGPAGITLARLLQRDSIQCVIFEGEPDRYSRNQGGTLDLHPRSGQLALRDAGLIDDFNKHARPEADVMKLLDPNGDVLWDDNPLGNWRPKDSSDRPEIDRTALRDLLLDSLEPGTVRWGHRLDRVVRTSDGNLGHTLYFTNGTKESGIDLLVGAEGAFSKVRKLVTDVEPHYSGIMAVELWQMDADAKNPWLSKQIGAGSCFMSDQDRALLCQRQGNGSTRAYACLRKPPTWLDDCGIDWSHREAARATLVKEYFDDCGEDIKRMMLGSQDDVIPRKLYMLPVGLTWQSQPNVTILGDAAHLMTPFAGVGVNTALADALGLAKAVIARKEGLFGEESVQATAIADAIREYEVSMFERAEQMTSQTWQALVERFTQGSSQRRADKFKKGYEMMRARSLEKEKLGQPQSVMGAAAV